MPAAIPTQPTVDALRWTLGRARVPAFRPMVEWVESEVWLPNGPFAGRRYRHARHPVSRLWFSELDSGRWSRAAATGPTQNGKTVMCYALPILYHLFELQETVIVGLPTMEMANDKWREDLLPIIEASRFRKLLPTKGEGSRGGQVRSAVRFQNGATLRFMSGGGSDKKRAGFTSRVVAVTETDGMDEAGGTSREADKIEQIEGRTRAFGRRGKRVYLECTVSVEEGRIWQEVKQGTDSKIVRPCPHCSAWVTPERDDLIGWEQAQSEDEAAELASWACPACGELWSEDERRDAAEQAKLVHKGQEVTPEGDIVGDLPKTSTLGFRWSAIDNPFATAADLGAEEWRSRNATDQDNAERKMRQFVWCLPYEPPDLELTPLDADSVKQRKASAKRGIVPEGCTAVTVGVDTGKRALHWVVMATGGGKRSIIDYGVQPVEADRLGVHRGLVEALAALWGSFEDGWQTEAGEKLQPSQVWIDSGYHEHTDAVYEFCATVNKGPVGAERYRPTKGYGEGQRGTKVYGAPHKKSGDVIHIGREMHVSKVRRNKLLKGVLLVHLNADFWKSELHQALTRPADEAGAVSLFDSPNAFEHSEIAAHFCAEKQMEKFIPGRGTVIVWERISRANHYLDAAYSALAAADHLSAVRKPKKRKTLRDLAEGK